MWSSCPAGYILNQAVNRNCVKILRLTKLPQYTKITGMVFPVNKQNGTLDMALVEKNVSIPAEVESQVFGQFDT